ncbi:NlpC/P60 family protein [Peribacillus sp. NPDC097206]|uniref:NlpC/P60 family protein n=1 Tax=Peribacillus sp. NPDC097206 TaxID=3364398 RepID=UPI00380FC91C
MKKWIASAAVASALMLTPLQAFANIGDQTLRPGMTHSDVKQLQTLLKTKGYFTYTGSSTTYYGTYSTTAVKNFQKAKGLTADGIAGRNTFNALGVYNINNTSMINYAKTLIGSPYKWAGTTPAGFDCSGFIYYVFQKSQGITLPRTTSQLYGNTGLKVSTPSKGDLVFFDTSSGKTGVSHAGIYIGNNQFIHASSSKGITITDMNNSYWAPKYLGAKTL